MKKQIILKYTNDNEEREFAIAGSFLSYEVSVYCGNLCIVFMDFDRTELMELGVCFAPEEVNASFEIYETPEFQESLTEAAKEVIDAHLIDYFSNDDRILNLNDIECAIDAIALNACTKQFFKTVRPE